MTDLVKCDRCGTPFSIQTAGIRSTWSGDYMVQYFTCPGCHHRYQILTTDTELRQTVERHEKIAAKIRMGQSKHFRPGTLKKYQAEMEKLEAEQKKRTRGKAEVFTPLWVVKKMADHAEQELNKGNWEQFVHERCLEITCGEAPFLTSRYDPTTGEPVAIPDRVGILDRKLRAIQENANHKFQWKALVSSAYQSVYGYEYQGDNLLLARVNLFLTFTENWIEKLGLPISASWAIAVATRISWNIWQMDGLKDTAPGTDTLCLIYDWEKNEEVTFRQIKEESDNV